MDDENHEGTAEGDFGVDGVAAVMLLISSSFIQDPSLMQK